MRNRVKLSLLLYLALPVLVARPNDNKTSHASDESR